LIFFKKGRARQDLYLVKPGLFVQPGLLDVALNLAMKLRYRGNLDESFFESCHVDLSSQKILET
jgi:hypothetical protein